MRTERTLFPNPPSQDRRSQGSAALRIWLLGSFRVSVGSRTIDEGGWRLRKAASLIKLLALAPGHRLHREQAMDLLWPHSGRKAASNNLRRVLHAARRVFDPDVGSRYLASENESLVLHPRGELWVDVEAFEEVAATARHGKDPAAYRAALELYAGDLLPEDRYEEWAEESRQRLRETYLSLLLGLARLYEAHGDQESAIETLQRAVAEQPSREEAHVGLMRLYALSGSKGEALAQYGRLEEVLLRELGTEPSGASCALREEISASRFPPKETASPSFPDEEAPGAGRHNLPASRDSFVGREHEMVEIKRTLAMTRLLTLSGVGGSGKTRLALEVARDLVGAYADGVWLVELAPLTEGELVPQAVIRALGVREQADRSLTDTLAKALREKHVLLVVDNCEHLADSVANVLDTLLDSCPRLRVLATSRVELGLAGEAIWRVSSLSAPDTDRLPAPGEMTRYGAVKLFLDRARLRLPSFELTQENTPTVAEVCRKLEGMPLAIELATARVGKLSVGQISERLKDPLGLLSTGGRTAVPRQRTLRATLDWSYELLGQQERKLFQRLSVFAGGWDLEAAEAVGAAGDIRAEEVLDLLSGLVEHSMVVAETGRAYSVRYKMLEPVRQYARERLKQSGEVGTVRSRHASLFLALAERTYPELRGPRQVERLHRLAQDNDNLRAAIGWLLSEGDVVSAARLGHSLWPFWYFRVQHGEGRVLMEAVLESESDLPPILRIRANVAAGTMVYGRGDMEATERYGKKLLGLSRQMGGNACAEGWGRMGLGLVEMDRGNFEGATSHLKRSLPFIYECDELALAAVVHHALGVVSLLQDDHELASSRFEEGLALARRVGDKVGISDGLYNLAQVALIQGDHGLAKSRFEEAMALSEQVGDRAMMAYCLEGLAAIAGTQGKMERSACLFGAAERLLETLGLPVWYWRAGKSPEQGHGREPRHQGQLYKPYRSLYERVITHACAELGEAAFEAAWTEGRGMSFERTVEYARSGEETALPSVAASEQPSAGTKATPLTRREEELTALVARGFTNRQIASELSISEHTAATHVRKILKRLGLHSRTELATWVSEQQQPFSSDLT